MTVKIKTSQITLLNIDYDEKLSILEKLTDFRHLDILDEPDSNRLKINIPILFRGEAVKKIYRVLFIS